MMEPIENQEIRGVSLKNLGAIVVSTASIIITVLTSYSNLKSVIVTNKMEIDSKIELLQYQMKSVKDEQASQKIEINDLRRQLNESKR